MEILRANNLSVEMKVLKNNGVKKGKRLLKSGKTRDKYTEKLVNTSKMIS
jgi:hypothetical protein